LVLNVFLKEKEEDLRKATEEAVTLNNGREQWLP
jgi:hypothetical protein